MASVTPSGGPAQQLPEIKNEHKKGKNTGVEYVHIQVGDKKVAAYADDQWSKVNPLRRLACWIFGLTTEVKIKGSDGKEKSFMIVNESAAKALELKGQKDSQTITSLLAKLSNGKIHAPQAGQTQKAKDEKAASPADMQKAKGAEGQKAAEEMKKDVPATDAAPAAAPTGKAPSPAKPATLDKADLKEIFRGEVSRDKFEDNDTFKAITSGPDAQVGISAKDEFFVVVYHLVNHGQAKAGVPKGTWEKIEQRLDAATKKNLADAANNEAFKSFLIKECKLPENLVNQVATTLRQKAG